MSLENQGQKKERKREIYLDILRIVAIFLIIIIHVSAQNWYVKQTNIFSFEWNIFNIYMSLSQSGTAIFVMISGALFLSSNYSIEKIYKVKILRIIIAFIFWALIYTLLFHKHSTLKDFIVNFSKGEYHLWFLYMIMGLYILVPFFKKIVENEFLMKYFLILSFIFSIIIIPLRKLVNIFKLDVLKTVLFKNILDKVDMHFVVGFSFYFILGYFLHKTIIDSKKSILIYFLGILGLISTIIFSVLLSRYIGEQNQLFYNRFTPNMFFYILFIFVFFKNIFKDFKFTDKQKEIIVKMSQYSFGAYLVHVLILKWLKQFFALNTLSFNPIFSVPVIAIIVFGVSFLISALLNKIPLLNKYIV